MSYCRATGASTLAYCAVGGCDDLLWLVMGGGGYDDGTVAAPGHRALRNTETRGRRGPDYLYRKNNN